jgi:hypothetical protein
MQHEAGRRFVLSDYTVERRQNGWYFGTHFEPSKTYRGPYVSVASVTLMIARQLKKEVERRDTPSQSN